MSETVSPPQNAEAEAMLLASLMEVDAYVAEAQSIVDADDFYREGHRAVFRAINDLFQIGEPVEPITVLEQLTKNGELEVAGGRVAVLDLMETPFIAASYRTYAEMVRDAATQRRLLRVGKEIERMIAQREGETARMLQDAETLVYDLSQKGVRGDFTRAHELVIKGIERLTAAEEAGGHVTGVPTGFIDLDRVIGGLHPGNMVVVAARPSMGKTALALGIAEHAALNENLAVAVFSLEMSGDELIQRLLASTAVVDAGRIRAGKLAPEDWSRIGRAADRLSAARLYIDDSEGVTVGEMRTKLRRLKSRDGLDLLVVDYIQLMEGNRGRKDENRVQEISTISRSLKMLARDLDVPIICVSQLNRSPDARNDKRPMLSDLRESGAIEQDADLVLMIYRDDYYNPENSEDKGLAEVLVAKNRHGPTDRVKLTFRGSYAKFDNLDRDH
ncbi:replicative DNA helicase [Miltoncostaea marina]|uniref:replicative DNA helicase n=1 Tax=Miltoncostaea marina TaxID=2843215 RepID=UPI001C3D5533|nr:replicative DNA helicase [Miltoncostaea marina]